MTHVTYTCTPRLALPHFYLDPSVSMCVCVCVCVCVYVCECGACVCVRVRAPFNSCQPSILVSLCVRVYACVRVRGKERAIEIERDMTCVCV